MNVLYVVHASWSVKRNKNARSLRSIEKLWESLSICKFFALSCKPDTLTSLKKSYAQPPFTSQTRTRCSSQLDFHASIALDSLCYCFRLFLIPIVLIGSLPVARHYLFLLIWLEIRALVNLNQFIIICLSSLFIAEDGCSGVWFGKLRIRRRSVLSNFGAILVRKILQVQCNINSKHNKWECKQTRHNGRASAIGKIQLSPALWTNWKEGN